MNSREKILATVKTNQPEWCDLPPLPTAATSQVDLTPLFISTLEAIGGAVFIVPGFDAIAAILRERYPDARRIVSGLPELGGPPTPVFGLSAPIAPPPTNGIETPTTIADPHTLENVDLAILPAHFGVAENGACWITEEQMIERALPFIAQHLALILPGNAILPDMHAAYEWIATLDVSDAYGFATFIAGPSKTADIEQSLVLGAHGPASLAVFLLDGHPVLKT